MKRKPFNSSEKVYFMNEIFVVCTLLAGAFFVLAMKFQWKRESPRIKTKPEINLQWNRRMCVCVCVCACPFQNDHHHVSGIVRRAATLNRCILRGSNKKQSHRHKRYCKCWSVHLACERRRKTDKLMWLMRLLKRNATKNKREIFDKLLHTYMYVLNVHTLVYFIFYML